MNPTVTRVTNQNFNDAVLNADRPVLVDFWAPWCAPCRMQNPILEELARELDDVIRVVKIDVDDNAELSARYGIASVPSILVFQAGQPVFQSAGVKTQDQLTQILRELKIV